MQPSQSCFYIPYSVTAKKQAKLRVGEDFLVSVLVMLLMHSIALPPGTPIKVNGTDTIN